MTTADDFERAADQLSEALFALDDVDLNVLTADEVRTVLQCRDDLQDICLDCRQNQRAVNGVGDE